MEEGSECFPSKDQRGNVEGPIGESLCFTAPKSPPKKKVDTARVHERICLIYFIFHL